MSANEAAIRLMEERLKKLPENLGDSSATCRSRFGKCQQVQRRHVKNRSPPAEQREGA